MTLPFWKPAAGLIVVAVGGFVVWAEDCTFAGRTGPKAVCAAEPPATEEEKGPPVFSTPAAPPPPPAAPASAEPTGFSAPPPAPKVPEPPPALKSAEPEAPPAFTKPVASEPPAPVPPAPVAAVPPPPAVTPMPAAVPPMMLTPAAPSAPAPAAPVLSAPVVPGTPPAPPRMPAPATPSAEPLKPVGFSSPATTTVITSSPIVNAGGVPACQLYLKVGTGSPHFEIRSGDEVLLKAKCDRVDMQSSPDSSRKFLGLQATGRVQLTGSGLSGSCEQMTVQSLGGEVTLKGNVRVAFRKGSHVTEMVADQMTFQVSNKGLTATTVTTESAPSAPR